MTLERADAEAIPIMKDQKVRRATSEKAEKRLYR